MTANNLNYGVIGNCKTAALVSDKGFIDFLCLPTFSSFTVFARLLDDRKGGTFGFEVPDDCGITQEYLKDTNILVTHFVSSEGAFDVYDFMPRYRIERNHYYCPPDVVRYLKLVAGAPRLKVVYDPKLCYAEGPTTLKRSERYIKAYYLDGQYESMYLYSSLNLEKIENSEWMTLSEDQYLLLSYNQKVIAPDLEHVNLQFEKTKVYWMEWLSLTVKIPCFDKEVRRSALVLKLLSYEKTGALIAAVTTSLPETVGEVRNWDYRFCWIRDASMTVSVLIKLGHRYLAQSFLNFILDVVPYKNETIQIMYGIDGEKELKEKHLDHLSGYEGSRPVRVGNAAYRQRQNDVYGILADLIYVSMDVYYQNLNNIEDLWTVVRSLVRNIERHWTKKDQSIWEFRTKKEHYVFSKVLCWVGIDRAAKIAKLLGQDQYTERWQTLADKIRKDILTKGWNEEVGAFVQYYGGKDLDSANLLMEHYGFIDPSDPRFVSTVEKTYEKLCVDGLMYRYTTADDFGLPKSSFTVCTFWMIHSLYRVGKKTLARSMFRQVLGYANHLGLFSEDIDFQTKRLLGNFPQAYSHIALIDTALLLCEDLDLDEEDRLRNIYKE